MIDVEVKGLKELQRKTEQMVKDLHGAPMLNAMRDSTLTVQRKAKINAPVDTGRLRASILPEIRMATNEVLGVVGSNVIYAPYQEFGTGQYSMMISGFRRFARGLMKRGGIRPKLYLTNAFRDSEKAINRRFERAVHEVVEK